jgi:hypothetical protein
MIPGQSQDQGGNNSLLKDLGVGLGFEAVSTLAEQGIALGGGALAAYGISKGADLLGNPALGTKAGVYSAGLRGMWKAGHANAKGVIANYGLALGTALVGGLGYHLLNSNVPHNKINSNEAVNNNEHIMMGALGGGIMGGAFVGATAVGAFEIGPKLFQEVAKSKSMESYLNKRRNEIQNNQKMSAAQKQEELARLDRYEKLRDQAANNPNVAMDTVKKARNQMFGNTEIGNRVFDKMDRALGKVANMKPWKRNAAIMGGSVLLGALAGAIHNATDE